LLISTSVCASISLIFSPPPTIPNKQTNKAIQNNWISAPTKICYRTILNLCACKP
jgi:hypothetical protein